MNAFTSIAVPVDAPAPKRPTHDPRFELRVGAAVIGVFVIGFLGWSSVARLDSSINAAGVVRVAGSRQTVQSQTNGVITSIKVRDGDHVNAGDVLVNFGTFETLATERSLASRVIGLQAEIARITAENLGSARIATPDEWTALDPIERQIADRALASEQANLLAKRSLLSSETAVLRERIAEVKNQIGGFGERRRSSQRQSALNVDELNGVQTLFNKGYATKTRVLALQRSAAAIDGDIGSIDSEIARLGAVIGETRLQILQLTDQRNKENADRFRSAQTELQTALPQWRSAREQLAETVARAPVSGTIMGLLANTVGGVAPRGAKLLEIIPDKGALEVSTQIALADANDLQPGQRAEVRIGGMRGRNLPVLHGTVSQISADAVTDEKTGRSYFTATIAIPNRALEGITRAAGVGGGVKPGTPVEVVVPLKARTALEFWLGPLLARFRPAMTEQ